MNVPDVVAELQRLPLLTVGEAKARDGGAPREPGFYAWWVAPGVIPNVPAPPHPVERAELLYVGIAPNGPNSSARLRSRLCRQHIGGNVAASTFRFGLASLLWETEGWTPLRSASGKYRLSPADNAALSDWQRHHLRVRWAVVEQPWMLEKTVIEELCPPMNRAHNRCHLFYDDMGAARRQFRSSAVPV